MQRKELILLKSFIFLDMASLIKSKLGHIYQSVFPENFPGEIETRYIFS